MSRKLEVLGAVGLSAAIAACSAEVKPSPTERPLESYNYRVAIQLRNNNALVCYTDTFPFRDDMPWTIYLEEGYCPDSEERNVKDLPLDILNNNFQLVDQKSLRENGQEIPPVYFGE